MVSDPNVAIVLIALGVLGIYVELCRPGRVVPGITGGVLLIIGVASIVNATAPIHWPFVLAIISALTLVTVYLLRIAIRARRNKRVI
jgi:membrane-bound serine protease (ClpP class)